jgi:hypothetical protein
MAEATIRFVDVDGEISVTVFLEGGFQPTSHAHQHAQLCIKHLDEIGRVRDNQDTRWVAAEEVPAIALPPEAHLAVAGGSQR